MDEEEAEPSENNLTQSQLYLPTKSEIIRLAFETGVHSSDFEKLCTLLEVENEVRLRPHDMEDSEIYNKAHPLVVRHLPLQYRRGKQKLDYTTYIAPGVKLHRESLHHVLGNGDEINPNATREDHLRTAIDAFSTIRGHRVYLDPAENQDGIMRVFLKGKPPEYKRPPEYKIEYFKEVLEKLKETGVPDLSLFNRRDFVKNKGKLPNTFDLPQWLYERICDKTTAMFEMARFGTYLDFWKSKDSKAYTSPMCCAE